MPPPPAPKVKPEKPLTEVDAVGAMETTGKASGPPQKLLLPLVVVALFAAAPPAAAAVDATDACWGSRGDASAVLPDDADGWVACRGRVARGISEWQDPPNVEVFLVHSVNRRCRFSVWNEIHVHHNSEHS